MSKPEILELREQIERLKKRKMKVVELYKGDLSIPRNTEKIINLSNAWTNYDMCVVTVRGDYNHFQNIICLKGRNVILDIHTGTEQSGYYATGYIHFNTDTTLRIKCEHAQGWGDLSLWEVLGINFNAEESEE